MTFVHARVFPIYFFFVFLLVNIHRFLPILHFGVLSGSFVPSLLVHVILVYNRSSLLVEYFNRAKAFHIPSV